MGRPGGATFPYLLYDTAMPLDIGVGILLSIGVAEAFGVPLTPWLVVFGIASALLPDIDIGTLLWGKWKHRTVTHFPLAYVLPAMLVYVLAGPVYGTLFALGVLAHFIHDTFGIGWGIAWGYPFSTRKFLFFPGKEREPFMGRFASWLPEEEPALRAAEAAMPGSGEHWMKRYYFRPNLLAYIEYGTLIIALAALAGYTAG